MTHKTKGIVLRSIKYGETSLVVTIFTELFGIQTYMVNGVRTLKKSSAKANHFQPAAQLDLLVYHSENKAMQRIKEFSWLVLYDDLLNHVIKNSIASYMAELLQKCLKQPEPNTDLFDFCASSFMELDKADKKVTANFALFFTLHLPHFFGFRITDNYSSVNLVLDLQEGNFIDQQPTHPYFIDGKNAELTAELLRVMQPGELEEFQLNRDTRRILLLRYLEYYALHIPDFGQIKTLMIMHEVL
ncbi:MAG: DNA repair protein RecO [Chitinophagaceae bacterium]|nr:DNA repair protein RecO [Chitinophagaceae bacterium]